ncbi:histidine kinase dimerization/phosphoacceptor domain -containing protein [Pseudorhizobium tarimense]|uniref:histidine kinase dimerization/phosphoacceptor domain -containing protein n=1 Tax=Pseudorhizobium tarimense TaxID=1079109 RepID=UPI001FF54358|nr:histidine kinase dimerization/phosphoacceptor domain -containing protein [Pseudorhizobium tarimense]MCJ8520976.1 hypothetical protein [Pseudorhizobium tarimense]
MAHRIKNTLQIISSFVSHKIRRAAEPCAQGYERCRHASSLSGALRCQVRVSGCRCCRRLLSASRAVSARPAHFAAPLSGN